MRDEAALLPRLLSSLAALELTGVDAVACFFLDGCSDNSEAIVRGAVLPIPLRVASGPLHRHANAGRARAAAMALASDAVGEGAGALLLTTDADSRPRGDWLQAAARALTLSDVAAGRIVRDGACDRVQARVEAYWDRLHAFRRFLDPVTWETGGCHQAGGANLAMRAEVYRSLGGFRAVAAGEDALLCDEASRAGYRVRHDPAMLVETSARRAGRARGGMADALRTLDRGTLPVVADPRAEAWQFRRHAAARAAFARMDEESVRAKLGAVLKLTPDHVLGVARDCPNAESFATRIVPAASDAGRLVELDVAEEALTVLEGQWRRRAA